MQKRYVLGRIPLKGGKSGEALQVRPCRFCGLHKLGPEKCGEFECTNLSYPGLPHICTVVCKGCRDKYCKDLSDGCPCCKQNETQAPEKPSKWVFGGEIYNSLSPIIDKHCEACCEERLQAVSERLGNQILDFKVTNQTQDEHIENLENKMLSTEAEYENLNAKNADLKAENEHLKALNQASGTITGVLQQQFSSVNDRLERKVEEFDKLQKQLEEKCVLISNLTKEMTKLKRALANIGTEVQSCKQQRP